MKKNIRTFFLLLIACSSVVSNSYRDASEALCFDAKNTFSLRQLQEIDMLETFEAVYKIAESENRESDLPQGFMHCLENLRSGDDRVDCDDFMDSLKLLFEFLMTMRSVDVEQRSTVKSRWHQWQLEEFAEDVVDEFWDVWRRLDILEEHCGITKS